MNNEGTNIYHQLMMKITPNEEETIKNNNLKGK